MPWEKHRSYWTLPTGASFTRTVPTRQFRMDIYIYIYTYISHSTIRTRYTYFYVILQIKLSFKADKFMLSSLMLCVIMLRVKRTALINPTTKILKFPPWAKTCIDITTFASYSCIYLGWQILMYEVRNIFHWDILWYIQKLCTERFMHMIHIFSPWEVVYF